MRFTRVHGIFCCNRSVLCVTDSGAKEGIPVRTNYKIAVAALVGFTVGAWLFHTRPVQAQRGRPVHVEHARPGVATSMDPSGSEIVGFSCVQGSLRDADCYIASR
jgi:hypothetical protein